MKILFALLLFTSPSFAVGLRDVPQLREAQYVASPRDPFIDASASSTLLGGVGERDLSKMGPPIEAYLGEIEAILRQTNKVGGIAFADGEGLSVVNGRIMKPGGRLSAAISEEFGERLLVTSRYFGLGLEHQIAAKHLSFDVTRISKEGLHLNLKGMQEELLLGYRKDLSPQ